MTKNDASQGSDGIGLDQQAITDEQRQENVALMWEVEQASAEAEPHKVPQAQLLQLAADWERESNRRQDDFALGLNFAAGKLRAALDQAEGGRQ